MLDLQAINSFMMIGAHCDDVEVRGGGTFARLVREGKRSCYVVAVENPYLKPGHPHPGHSADEVLAIRRNEALRGAAILGADRTAFLGLQSFYLWKANREPVYPAFLSYEDCCEELQDVDFRSHGTILNAYTLAAARDRLVDLIRDNKPDCIFCNSPEDRHQDHYCLARFVDYVVADLRAEGMQLSLVFFEPGSGGPIGHWKPDLLIELAEDDVRKATDASMVFESQFDAGYIRNYCRGRSKLFGSVAGVPYAEAFQRPSNTGRGGWSDEERVRACIDQALRPPVVVPLA